MGLFSNMMDVFFEEEQNPQTPVRKTSTQSGPTTIQTAAPTPTSTPMKPSEMLKQKQAGLPISQPVATTSMPSATPAATLSINPQLDQKVFREFANSLNLAIEKNNLPGFDFFEFRQLYDRFKKDGKSDNEAIHTALTSSETMRVDKNTLIANYQHYVKVLNEQKKDFETELNDFFNSNIKGPKAEQEKIDKEIADTEQAIKKMIIDIDNLKEKKKGIGVDAVNAENQTQQVQIAFNKAYAEISKELHMKYII